MSQHIFVIFFQQWNYFFLFFKDKAGILFWQMIKSDCFGSGYQGRG